MTAVTKKKHEPGESAEALRAQILELTARFARIAHEKQAFKPGVSAVPVSGRVYGPEEVAMLVDASLDFWLTTGRFNDMFEKRLGRFLGLKYVLTCNSGSSANLLAVSALASPMLQDDAVEPGDEVITCAAGFPTTVNPIIQNGLVPVFVDVDIPTYNIRADLIEAAVTPKTRAIIAAHTLGNPFDLDTVMAVAKKHNLYVIEDTCDALGATYDGKLAGTIGEIGTVSFYPAHHITMGEGGAVFTSNAKFKRILESIRDWGRDCWCAPGADGTCKKRFDWQLGDLPVGYDHKYTYSNLGYNLKITDMQAAVGLAQLERLNGFIAARQANFTGLREGLKALEDMFILPEATPKSSPSWFGFPITLREEAPFTRDQILRHLNEKKIGTRLLFGGNLIRQPYMKGRNYRVIGGTEASDLVMKNTFWIGVYPGIEEAHLDYVINVITAFCKRGVRPV